MIVQSRLRNVNHVASRAQPFRRMPVVTFTALRRAMHSRGSYMRSIHVPGDVSCDVYGIDAAREYCHPTHHLEVSGQTGAPGTDLAQQVRTALDKLAAVLDRSGYGLDQITRLGIFTTDVDEVIELWPLVRERFAPATVPPHTLLGVVRFAHPGVRIEFDASAVRGTAVPVAPEPSPEEGPRSAAPD
jgi:enamine deaminase RidA (YjgF/YER057c/UK114 family)